MDLSGIVSKEELEIIDTLGEGEFGFVYRGSLRHLNGNLVSFFISFTGRMSYWFHKLYFDRYLSP